MINSIFKYPELTIPLSVEFELMSFFNAQSLIEYTQKYGIPIERSIQSIAAPNREYWMRFPASYITITAEDEQAFKIIQPLYPIHSHRIASPLIKGNKDILYIQKLFKCYIKCSDILIDNHIKFYFRFYKPTNIKTSIVANVIEQALYKLYKSALEVIVHPTNIQILGIDGLESWYELRNTLFLLHDVAKSINIENLNQFNLASCTQSSILLDFITSKISQ